MIDSFVIRKAVEEDLPVIASFNRAMALETEDKALDESLIQAGTAGMQAHPEYGFYLVAQKGGEIAGSLMVTYEWSDWRNGLFWWVQSVYVRPEFRRQGVYKALYDWVRSEVKKAPEAVGIRLYVETENIGAQKAYEALGMLRCHYAMYEELLPGE